MFRFDFLESYESFILRVTVKIENKVFLHHLFLCKSISIFVKNKVGYVILKYGVYYSVVWLASLPPKPHSGTDSKLRAHLAVTKALRMVSRRHA